MSTNNNEEPYYTKIPNELYEHLNKYRCSGVQKDILHAIIRQTYGFHRDDHELSASFIAVALDRDKSQVAKDISKLIKSKVIVESQTHTNHKGKYLKINESFNEWQEIRRRKIRSTKIGVGNSTHSRKNGVGKIPQSRVGKSTQSGVGKITHQIKKYKEIKKVIFCAVSNRAKDIISDPIWFEHSFFSVTQSFKDHLADIYTITEIQIKQEFDKIAGWKDNSKEKRITEKFILDWFDRNFKDKQNKMPTDKIPWGSPDTPSWVDG